MRKIIKVKIIAESLWDRLPQHVKDEINGVINYKPKEMVEVVHGEWISHDGYSQCNKCNSLWTVESNYCPNCGADMREK